MSASSLKSLKRTSSDSAPDTRAPLELKTDGLMRALAEWAKLAAPSAPVEAEAALKLCRAELNKSPS
jgi:hypothetical protein